MLNFDVKLLRRFRNNKKPLKMFIFTRLMFYELQSFFIVKLSSFFAINDEVYKIIVDKTLVIYVSIIYFDTKLSVDIVIPIKS